VTFYSLRLTALLYFSFLITQCEAKPVDVQQTVIINDANWPPFFFAGSRDKPYGFAKELLISCESEVGSQFTFLHFPIERMHVYMRSGQIDSNVYSYKKDREADLIYGKEVLFTTQYKAVTRKESGLTITQLQDIDGLRIGHLAGLKYTEEFRNKLKQVEKKGKLVTVRKSEDLLTLLTKKRIDVFIEAKETVNWHSIEQGIDQQLAYSEFTLSTNKYYFTVAKNSKRVVEPDVFIDNLDLCLIKLKASSEYDRLKLNYGLN